VGFSENLENNLKSLESQEERDPAAIAQEKLRRESDRQARIAAGPYAEQLKSGAFTQGLLAHATRLGFGKRAKVHITWLDTTLRLDARNVRLELRPTGAGILAHQFVDGQPAGEFPVDLAGDPEALAKSWLETLV
jgi:hypothetical protein